MLIRNQDNDCTYDISEVEALINSIGGFLALRIAGRGQLIRGGRRKTTLEFYTDNVYKARKVHKCDLCNQEIIIGEKYHRQSGKYEGDFFDRCLHIHCNNIITVFCKENNENEYSPDWIVDWLSNNHCYSCEKKEECEVNILQCDLILEHFKGA